MSSSTEKILDLIATDYSLYYQEHHEQHPTQKESEKLRDLFMKIIPKKKSAELIANGYRLSSLKETEEAITAHQTKLAEAGIEKSEKKLSPKEVELTYKIRSTPEISQFFHAPWVQKSKKTNSEIQSVSTTERADMIEISCNLKFKT